MKKIEILNYIEDKGTETNDPYDIWFSGSGLFSKDLFYKNKFLGAPFVILLSLIDLLVPIAIGIKFYKKREYAMVRAHIALIFLKEYSKNPSQLLLSKIKNQLDWLVQNSSKGHSGIGWGLNVKYSAKNATYPANTPYVTNTPYALEAFYKYKEITQTTEYDFIFEGVYRFLTQDINVLYESETELIQSYSPVPEKRLVVNANSYIMYMYSILHKLNIGDKELIENRIQKIYHYVKNSQSKNGEWYYFTDDKGGNFIDCFHSCFIIKNIIKTNELFTLPNTDEVIKKGYNYLINNFKDSETGLYKRFTVSDIFSPTKYDLYDNAEMLGLAVLLNDKEESKSIKESIKRTFVNNKNIYSKIVMGGFKANKNTLRWAVMPYLLNLMTYHIKYED